MLQGGGKIDTLMDFLQRENKPIIVIGTLLLILYLTLIKHSGDITSRIFRGLLGGASIGCVLYFLLDKDLTAVLITGIASFLVVAIFGRVR